MRRRHLLLMLAVVGLLSVALVAVLLYQSPLMTTVVLTPDAAEPPAGVPAVRVGDPVIDFTAPAYDGTTFSLAALRGKPVLIKFFRGHW